MSRATRTIAIGAAALTAVAGFAGPAAAAKKKGPRATISACAGTGLTITVAALPSKGAKVSRARLELQFTAVPERGAVRRGKWIAVGQKRSTVRSQRFGSLPAGPWAGSVRYRWRRGSKTVASGVARTEEATIGRASGRSACVLVDDSAGVQQQIAVDRDPPVLGVSPGPDQTWKRAPVTVSFAAFDSSSGIASVDYTVNGAPGQGRSVTLSSEGEYDIRAVARDLAGNVSNEARTFVRIDETPPTTPTVVLPDHASDDTPRVQWSAATDARSGVQSYTVTVMNGGQTVQSQQVGAGTLEATLGKLANGSYTVRVTAFDGAQAPANSASSSTSALSVNDVLYDQPFDTCPAGFTFPPANPANPPNRWSCADMRLFTDQPQRTGGDRTYVALSPMIAYPATSPAGEPIRFSFTRAFSTQNDPGGGDVDSGTVEVVFDGAVPPGASKPFTGGVINDSDSITFPQPASAPANVQLRFTLMLDGCGLCLDGPAGDGFSVDDLRLERNP